MFGDICNGACGHTGPVLYYKGFIAGKERGVVNTVLNAVLVHTVLNLNDITGLRIDRIYIGHSR